MKYCVEISEEQLRIISVAVDEYMRLPINLPTHRLDTGSGNTIHGERASTLYTLSSISSG